MSTRIFKLATGTVVHQLRIRANWLAVVCLTVISLGAVAAVQGQYQGRTYSRTDLERLIRDVEQSSQEFQRDFDAWLDRSPLDGQQREDEYNRQIQNLTSALRTLRSNFDRRNDWWLARSDMIRVLNAAGTVNSLISSREARGGLNRQWNRLRRNIDRLAAAFNLPPVGSNYAGIQPTFPDFGGNVRNCSVTGTFRGFTNTGESELTVAGDGTATIRSLNSNAVYTGRCVNNVLYFDWGSFNIAREGRGIRTVEIGNESNRTSYRRVSGFGGDTRPTYPDQYGNVPRWAVGVFRGMTNDGEAELTIAPNGVATLRSLNSNQVHTGSFSNGVLNFDWGTFQVDLEGNSIRTVELRNPRNRTSYRRISGYVGDTRPGYPSPGYDPGYPNQYGNVPNWAVGTFRGMTDSGETELTISPDGSATARSLNTNAVHNGRYANDVLTFDWGSFRVRREGRGIRTEEIGNQQSVTSYRRVN